MLHGNIIIKGYGAPVLIQMSPIRKKYSLYNIIPRNLLVQGRGLDDDEQNRFPNLVVIRRHFVYLVLFSS